MSHERSRLRRALVVAFALHALAAVIAGGFHAAPRRPAVPKGKPMLVWIETSERASFETTPGTPAETSADELALGSASLALRLEPRSIAPHPSEPDGAVDEPGSDGANVGAPDSQGAETSPSGTAVAPNGTERLSLDALGVGKNPFLADAARDISKPPPLSQAFRRSITDAIAKADQARGLGPEEPVIARLELETRLSDAPGNSTALFRATTDGRGNLVAFEFIEANGGTQAYSALAARVLAALRNVKLRIPRGARGVTMDIRVVSRVELPSGHDPGMGVDVLGIPLKKQGGPKSPRVSLLHIDPNGYKIELPGAKPITLPSLPLDRQFEIVGDPIDIGAKAQRMVRAHLEHLDADIPESVAE